MAFNYKIKTFNSFSKWMEGFLFSLKDFQEISFFTFKMKLKPKKLLFSVIENHVGVDI